MCVLVFLFHSNRWKVEGIRFNVEWQVNFGIDICQITWIIYWSTRFEMSQVLRLHEYSFFPSHFHFFHCFTSLIPSFALAISSLFHKYSILSYTLCGFLTFHINLYQFQFIFLFNRMLNLKSCFWLLPPLNATFW